MSGSTISKKVEAIALGAFDGMHRGHQKLFERLGLNGAVVVIEKGAVLTPKKVRCRYTSYPCFFYPLEKIKNLDAESFIQKLLHDFPNLKRVVVGYDFAFGKDRRYGIDDLKRLFDGEVVVVDEVKIDGISIHSRTIKELLKQGEVQKAAKLLGRWYSIEGEVIKGQGVGAKELFATLNLRVKDYLLPKDGVYATFTKIDAQLYPSVTFIGHRQSTDGAFSIETHLLDTNLKHRPKRVEIFFIAFLRQNKKFENLEKLKAQIKKDIQQAKEILKEVDV